MKRPKLNKFLPELLLSRIDAIEVLENLEAGIIITDSSPDNIVIFCNSAFEHISGYSQAEIVGQSSRILQGNQDQVSIYQTIKKAIADRIETLVEIENRHKNGSFYCTQLKILPLNSNYFIGYYPLVSDRAKNMIDSLEAILQELTGNKIVFLQTKLQPPFIITIAARRASALLRISSDELQGKSILDYLGSKNNNFVQIISDVQEINSSHTIPLETTWSLDRFNSFPVKLIAKIDQAKEVIYWLISPIKKSVEKEIHALEILSSSEDLSVSQIKNVKDLIESSLENKFEEDKIQNAQQELLSKKLSHLNEIIVAQKEQIETIEQQVSVIFGPITEKGGILEKYLRRKEKRIKWMNDLSEKISDKFVYLLVLLLFTLLNLSNPEYANKIIKFIQQQEQTLED